MEQEYFSQPGPSKRKCGDRSWNHFLSKQSEKRKSGSNPSSPRVFNGSVLSNDRASSPDLQQSQMSTGDSEISQLFDSYKTINDKLTSSLVQFRNERISLENELEKNYRESEYLDDELKKQDTRMKDLQIIMKKKSHQLTKERDEIKKNVEILLLEIQEKFSSVNTADRFINDHKTTLAEIIKRAHEFVSDKKQNLKLETENSINIGSSFSKKYKEIMAKFCQEFNDIKRKKSVTQLDIERGIDLLKEKSQQDEKYDQEINSLTKETKKIDEENIELKASLINLDTKIKTKNEELQACLENWEIEKKELTEIVSQKTIKYCSFELEKKALEEKLANLTKQEKEMLQTINLRKAELENKTNIDNSLKQELESLENINKSLKKDVGELIIKNENNKAVETELKESELNINFIKESLEHLEKAHKDAQEGNMSCIQSLAKENEKLNLIQNLYHQKQQYIERMKTQLDEKYSIITTTRKETDMLRCILNGKLAALKNIPHGTEELEKNRKDNDELLAKLMILEKEIESKKKTISNLKNLQQRLNEAFQKYDDDFQNELVSSDDEESNEIFNAYTYVLEDCSQCEIDNMDDLIKNVEAHLECTMQKMNQMITSYNIELMNIKQQHCLILKEIKSDEEERTKYYEENIVKINSEMNYVESNLSELLNHIQSIRNELASRLPELIRSISTGLNIYEELNGFYSKASSLKHSKKSSIHWDHIWEVLQEILRHPLINLAFLTGKHTLDVISGSSGIYISIITLARGILMTIIEEKEGISVENTMEKLLDLNHALYIGKSSDIATHPSSKYDVIFHCSSSESTWEPM